VRETRRGCGIQRPVRLAYQPPASSTFLSEQTSHQQPASSTFLSQQISTSHQPPAKRTGCRLVHPGRRSLGPCCPGGRRLKLASPRTQTRPTSAPSHRRVAGWQRPCEPLARQWFTWRRGGERGRGPGWPCHDPTMGRKKPNYECQSPSKEKPNQDYIPQHSSTREHRRIFRIKGQGSSLPPATIPASRRPSSQRRHPVCELTSRWWLTGGYRPLQWYTELYLSLVWVWRRCSPQNSATKHLSGLDQADGASSPTFSHMIPAQSRAD
jgi:hypothetical protein